MHARSHRIAGSVLGAVLAASLARPAAAQSAFRVKDINPTGSSNPTELTVVGGLFSSSTLYFAADDGVNGVELWKSNGTEVGTVLVEDINVGAASSSPANLTRVGGAFSTGRLFFTADDGVNGVELWSSDGTPAGTSLVKDISTGAGSSNPSDLTPVSAGLFSTPNLFFAATDGAGGRELWMSDGTAAGTVRVKDIYLGMDGSSPTFLTAVGTVLYFSASDGSNGNELWKSDGTPGGTVLVKDINSGPNSSNPTRLINVGGTLFLVAADLNGGELWTSDGTAGGTVMVKDIRPGFAVGSSVSQLINLGGTLFFQANDGVNGQELWKSDGTNVGTVMVKDINPGPGGAFIPNLFDAQVVNANGTLFFPANDGVHGEEPWKSDGTDAGTVLVKDILPGSADSATHYLSNYGSVAYFSAWDSVNNFELWRSDGRTGGTFLVQEIVAGAAFGAVPYDMTASAPFLFFTADDGVAGRELWATDLLFKDGVELGP